MNASHRADANARLILDVNARFCNHERHSHNLLTVCEGHSCIGVRKYASGGGESSDALVAATRPHHSANTTMIPRRVRITSSSRYVAGPLSAGRGALTHMALPYAVARWKSANRFEASQGNSGRPKWP